MTLAVAIYKRTWKSFSSVGLLLGTLFAAFSLTPSLVPRSAPMQGLLAGLSLSAGYAIGVLGDALWCYLELPEPAPWVERIVKIVAGAACLVVAVAFLMQVSEWQNSIRTLMDMEPVESTRPLIVGLIALPLFIGLLAVSRLFRHTYRWISKRLKRFVPRRVAKAVAIAAAASIFWSAANGLLIRYLMSATDRSYQQLDALIEPDVEQPRDPLKTGSPPSLISWKGLGRAGREYITSGPSAADLGAFFGEETLEPIRVYVGLNSAETVAERARLALEELKRVGAFERSMLIIITPTGTGWVDPGAIDTLEYLYRGDIASVAVQYSYLASPFSLLVEPDKGAQTAQALFDAVYTYWTELPHDQRPRLYLFGLSLGALYSDRSFDLYDVVGDPFHGVLWSGPPFRSETWREATQQRVPGSPAWLPRFRDSTIIRFTNQHNQLEMPGVPWGPLRIAFLQYATDPVTFFKPSLLWHEPAWLQPPRGPDVTPALRWIPIVTMLQILADMLAGNITPPGYGHNYAPNDYIDAWLALTEPPGWTEDDIRRLKTLFAP